MRTNSLPPTDRVSSARQRLRTPTRTNRTFIDPSIARPVRQPLGNRIVSALRGLTYRRMAWKQAASALQKNLRLFLKKVLPPGRPLYRYRIVIVIGCAALFVWWVVGHQTTSTPSQKKSTEAQNHSQVKPAELPKETPAFKTLLPAGKNIGELGGWTKISPPDKDPVYAYVDTIAGIQINVSQQSLPDTLRTDDAIKQLAESFDAREILKIDSTTVYIGTSAKGPQSIIFAKNNLLVLIKSSAKIAEPLWKNYITSLR